MAASIQGKSTASNKNSGRKPILVNKIEGFNDDINFAVLLRREDGIISLSDDRTIRIWLKRDSGQYWPSVCHTLPSSPISLDFNEETRRLMLGLDNGTVTEYAVSEDYNRLGHQRDFLAHQNTVTAVMFSLTREWLLSCSKDKFFQWHCSETGHRLGGYQCGASCLCIEFDEQSSVTFVGDYGGQIHVIKLKKDNCEFINALHGHSGSVRCLSWDKERSLLFSGHYNNSIIVWDIGGQKGSAFELQGHRARVVSLMYLDIPKTLISVGADNNIVFWDLDIKRKETPEWKTSDVCQMCDTPFLWNFKKMWEIKSLGMRQHHCRKCGRAICHNCSSYTSTMPQYGYEYPVRVCTECYHGITDEDKVPLATMHDAYHEIVGMHVDERKKTLITVGVDRIIKLWDIASLLQL